MLQHVFHDLSSLNISGATVLNSTFSLPNNIWHQSNDGISRIFYNYNGTSFFHSGNTNGEGFIFRNAAQADILTIKDSGTLNISGNLTSAGYTTSNNYYCKEIIYNYDTRNSAWYIDITTIQNHNAMYQYNNFCIYYPDTNATPIW